MSQGRHQVIVNPASGEGRCGRRVPAVLERLRAGGLEIEKRMSAAPRDATRIARYEYSTRSVRRLPPYFRIRRRA